MAIILGFYFYWIFHLSLSDASSSSSSSVAYFFDDTMLWQTNPFSSATDARTCHSFTLWVIVFTYRTNFFFLHFCVQHNPFSLFKILLSFSLRLTWPIYIWAKPYFVRSFIYVLSIESYRHHFQKTSRLTHNYNLQMPFLPKISSKFCANRRHLVGAIFY